MDSKRKDLDLKTKLNILQCLQSPGSTQASVAKEFRIARSTVSKLKKNENEIKKEASEGTVNFERKRKRQGKEEDVEDALLLWFKQVNAQGARIPGPMLKQKAEAIAKAKGVPFDATEGWLCRWKTRNNITWKKEHGEKQAADIPGAEAWKKDFLKDLLRDYDPADVFNADETGLYYRGLPDRGHCFKGEKLSGGKKAMERITVLVCANMTGTEKLPLFIIGKSKHPRCFPRHPKDLPVRYSSNKNAWMTSVIFEEYLYEWNRKLQDRGRNVLLFVDNCSAHPTNLQLSNIKIEFLPPNTTSLMQPMDMGIIKNLKGFYRVHLNKRVIATLDADEDKRALDVIKSINLLDALYFVKSAWQQVSEATIKNCYRKAGFCPQEQPQDNDTEFDPLYDVPVSEEMSLEELREQVEIDTELEIAGEQTEHMLLEEVQKAKRQRTDDTDDEDEPIIAPMSVKRKVEMLNDLRQYIQLNGLETCLPALKTIESKIYQEVSETKTQKRIEDFFQ